MTLQELREKHENTVGLARAILKKADDEKREVTAEENANADSYLTEADTLATDIRRREKLETHETEARSGHESRGVRAGQPDTTTSAYRGMFDAEAIERGLPTDTSERKELVAKATESWLRYGMGLLSQEERYLLRSNFDGARATTNALTEKEKRALAAGVDTAGGILVPEGFYGQIISAVKAYGGMRQAAYSFPTGTGQDLPIPTDNDTTNMGALLGENQGPVPDQDTTVGEVVLRGYMYTSKMVKVSYQLLEDSAYPIVPWLSNKLGTRIARVLNNHFTLADGAGKPRGITIDATSALTTASATAVTFDELLALKHSVDPGYRQQGTKWMFNDSSLLSFKKLKDSTGRYLWQSGIATKEPDVIDGDPFIINLDMPTIGAGVAAPVIYGKLDQYFIRDIGGTTLLQLRERFADNLQVGFIAFERHDGGLIDAGTHPVKSLTMHA